LSGFGIHILEPLVTGDPPHVGVYYADAGIAFGNIAESGFIKGTVWGA
jgi:hypothetical protein